MDKITKDMKIIDELPISSQPWRIHALPSAVVLINPEHPPRIVRDGVVKIMDAQNQGSFPDACVEIKTMAISLPRISTFFSRGSS